MSVLRGTISSEQRFYERPVNATANIVFPLVVPHFLWRYFSDQQHGLQPKIDHFNNYVPDQFIVTLVHIL